MVKIQNQISKVDAKVKTCRLCRLSTTRRNAVPGDGNIIDLDVMFVGEGPGRFEDEQGKPFVGAAGRVLDSMLKEAGLERSRVYITNIVKCRPPKNRKPRDDEIEVCAKNYLQKQIDLLKPKLICTLGATALEYFTGETKMGLNHGKLLKSKEGLSILPMYHPAATFRNKSVKALLQQDIKNIAIVLKKLDDPS